MTQYNFRFTNLKNSFRHQSTTRLPISNTVRERSYGLQ
uniref:Uncharacterized protein n=1 Tax=Arundo donax TaxID=35708 RepID=A0A0A9EAN2_ARUDO